MAWSNDDLAAYRATQERALDWLQRVLPVPSIPDHVADQPSLLVAFGRAEPTISLEAGTRIETLAIRGEHKGVGLLLVPLAYPACRPDEDAANYAAISELNDWIAHLALLKSQADTITDQSNDITSLDRAIADYDNWAAGRNITYYYCDPSFGAVDAAYTQYTNAFNDARDGCARAIVQLFGNAGRALSELRNAFTQVQQARTNFDSAGVGGVPAITAAHSAYQRQEQVCTAYQLTTWTVDGQTYDAAAYYQTVKDTSTQERAAAAITDLDQLRDEYRSRAIPVPTPGEFTQTKHSTRFTFAQLNTGDYAWAILRDVLLAELDAIATAMSNHNFPVQLNSVYRNPRRSSGLSRHQYGDAVDIQVFDFDNSGGGYDDDDWKRLRALVAGFQPSYIEPLSQSGAGHVHADWRNA